LLWTHGTKRDGQGQVHTVEGITKLVWWWTFSAAILETGWQRKASKETNTITLERSSQGQSIWGNRRSLPKNMLLGFVEEIGQDVSSILENAIDRENEAEPDQQGVAVVATMLFFRTQMRMGLRMRMRMD